MKQSQFFVEVIKEKYGEWLEMAGDDSPDLLADILASLLIKEMNEKHYYIDRLKEYERVKK